MVKSMSSSLVIIENSLRTISEIQINDHPETEIITLSCGYKLYI